MSRQLVAGVGVRLDDRELTAATKRTLRAVKDLRPLWPEYVGLYKDVSEGAFSARKWKPWSPTYAKWRAGKGGGLLDLTGALRASYQSPTLKGSAREATISNPHPTAHLHQLGTKRMPARPVFDVDDPAVRRRAQEVLIRYADTIGIKWQGGGLW